MTGVGGGDEPSRTIREGQGRSLARARRAAELSDSSHTAVKIEGFFCCVGPFAQPHSHSVSRHTPSARRAHGTRGLASRRAAAFVSRESVTARRPWSDRRREKAREAIDPSPRRCCF
jgi:hypothetical protein